MWVLSNINYRALRLMSESLYIITVVLLILTLLSPTAVHSAAGQCILCHRPIKSGSARCFMNTTA